MKKRKTLSKWKIKAIERTIANDRSYKRVVYNRFIICALSVLLQMGAYFLLLFEITTRSGVWLQVCFYVLALITSIVIVNDQERLSGKLSWIVVIIVFPIAGLSMYFTFGNGRPTRKMYKKICEAQTFRGDALKKDDYAETLIENGGRTYAVCRYISRQAGYPAYADGNVTYYPSGEKLFNAMLDALDRAQNFILVQYFIIASGKMWNGILKKLLEKAEQGVKIFVIYDDFGTIFNLPPDYDKYLQSLHQNIKCFAFNEVVPVFAVRMNNRDHRKILVVDGKTAFTGGVNLADEYIGEKIRFGHWKDSGVKITGSAVNSFTVIFFDTWNAFYVEKEDVKSYLRYENLPKTNAVIQPYDDSPLDRLTVGETAYFDIVNGAANYVYIFTPYLILDDYMRAALCNAALRGVDVRIVTPGVPDKKTAYRLTRANYSILLKAGVKIYEYTPGFIHAKSMVCDDEIAIVGTINLDYRSLYHHFENAVVFSDKQAVTAVKADAEETFALSKLCTKENTKRSWLGRTFDAILRLFEMMF